jgi:hypothetical protein
MKKLLLVIVIFNFLIACNKSSDNDWITIDFKTNYTIQIPEDFIGLGMVSFEGITFSKHSPDNKINLTYAYCNGLECFDFGDPITKPIPSSIQVLNSNAQQITLDRISVFYQMTDTLAILYYSSGEISEGRLFWKDENILKNALEIDFNYSDIQTVNKIIFSIQKK